MYRSRECIRRISTHGPARGPTLVTVLTQIILYFNSRPRKGADWTSKPQAWKYHHFNSRPRKGADGHRYGKLHQQAISTHGPARGPTLFGNALGFKSLFQLTAPQGGRRMQPGNSLKPGRIFQLTAPQGGRRRLWLASEDFNHFNSRPRKGADLFLLPFLRRLSVISTHGPARGPTSPLSSADGVDLFQLTAPQGGRPGQQSF